jgi:hypothetical protein
VVTWSMELDWGDSVRSEKAIRNTFRRLQLSTADDPKVAVGMLVAALPEEVRRGWDALEFDNAGRVAFAYQHPKYAHLLTAGFTLPTFREELEWILAQFEQGLPDGDVLDIGAGAGVTAALVALVTKRPVTACDPAEGAAAAIAYVAETVGAEVCGIESCAAGLPPDAIRDTSVVIAQSVLAHFEFEAECDCEAEQRSAFISTLAKAGEALIIEHATNIALDDGSATWLSFAAAMSDAGMYPVWETAAVASGYNVLIPDVPAYRRSMYARPKLCLRFSNSGDPRGTQTRLEALLAEHPLGDGWTD